MRLFLVKYTAEFRTALNCDGINAQSAVLPYFLIKNLSAELLYAYAAILIAMIAGK